MKKYSEPDEVKMSFLEHLDELRRRLVHSVVAVLVIFVVCWLFSDKIYHFLEIPVKRVMAETRIGNNRAIPATIEWKPGEEVWVTFRDTATLNKVTIPAGASVWAKVIDKGDGKRALATSAPWVIGESVIPANTELPTQFDAIGPEDRLVQTTVQGAFALYIRVSFYAAIFFAVPFLLYQIWAFVSPGLYAHEKAYALPVLGMGTVFFLLGGAFGYYIAFPRAASWLLELGSEEFKPLIHAEDYFDLITTILIGLGVVFQIPTLTFILSRIGLVTPQLLIRFWRYAFVVSIVLAAVISPTGDIPNLLVFAVPMVALYFLSVGIAWLFGRPRTIPESEEIAEV